MGKITKKRNDLKICNDLYVSTVHVCGIRITYKRTREIQDFVQLEMPHY